MFILAIDCLSLIREDRLNEIIQEDSTILDKAIASAVEEAAGFVRHRYDYDLNFGSVNVVTSDTVPTSVLNARYYQSTSKKFYYCILAGGTSLTNATYFTEGDNRNPKLVEVIVDIVLYNIHSRINPKSTPTHRRIRYDGDDPQQRGGALGWLKMVQNGTITPDLTVITDEDGETPQNTERIAYGSSSTDAYVY